MKKKIAVLLAAIMVMAMGTTSFAAKSPTTDTTETTDSTATDYANVSVGSVQVNGVVINENPEVKPVNTSKVNEAQEQAEDKVSSTAKVLQIVEINTGIEPFIQRVLELANIDLKTEDYDTLTMSFNVNGVTAGQKLTLLVQKTDGTWVTVTPDKVENGKVTATFTFEFINVAFVAYNASAQTGEMVSMLPAMMVVCVAGMAVCGKKVKYNR